MPWVAKRQHTSVESVASQHTGALPRPKTPAIGPGIVGAMSDAV
jgi:hypothetical protein